MAHILVVDDDDIVAELASGILISAGHACGFVSDAAQAWQLLQWRRPDLLLLDEDMPGERGSTFLRRLRASPAFYDLPVIMFTAQDHPTTNAAPITMGRRTMSASRSTRACCCGG